MTVGRQSIAIDLRRRAIDDYVGLSRVRVRRRGGRELRDEPYGSSRPGGSQTGHAEELVVHESSSSPPDVRRCEPVSVDDTRSSPLRQSIVGAPSPTFARYSPTTRQPPPPPSPGTPRLRGSPLPRLRRVLPRLRGGESADQLAWRLRWRRCLPDT